MRLSLMTILITSQFSLPSSLLDPQLEFLVLSTPVTDVFNSSFSQHLLKLLSEVQVAHCIPPGSWLAVAYWTQVYFDIRAVCAV